MSSATTPSTNIHTPYPDRLSVDNAAMLLIDHQEGFLGGILSSFAAATTC